MARGKCPEFSQALLKELLNYDPETGIFTWLVDRGRLAKRGQIAGVITELGYRGIKVNGHRYPSGRLAWLYMTGRWPTEEIDHINRDRSDDRFENLREASRWQNVANRDFKPNSFGVRGVRLRQDGLYEARIAQKHLGTFRSKDEAIKARKKAEPEYFGDRAWFS